MLHIPLLLFEKLFALLFPHSDRPFEKIGEKFQLLYCNG
jgi:hypothetical protein